MPTKICSCRSATAWHRLSRLLLALVLAIAAAGWSPMVSAGVGPTVKEVVEFTRIVQPQGHDNDTLQSQISPDGQHAFIVTRQADVDADRNLYEILLLEVSPQRLATRQAPEPTRLLHLESRSDSADFNPALQEAGWVGNGTIVFRARMNEQPYQAYRLDVPSRRLTQLTFEPAGLVNFAVSDDLQRVVYVASVPNPPMPPGARSFVAEANSFWSVHFGQDSLRAQHRRYRYMVAEAGSREAARQLGESFGESSGGFPGANVSPDGRWAALPRYEPARQLEWARQYPQIDQATAQYGPSLQLDPLGYYSRPFSYVSRRTVIYRLADAHEQTVLDAPDDSLQSNQLRTDRLWQGGGTSLVIAGTYLPRSDGDSSASTASHIVEYWPDSGRFKDIAVLQSRLKAVHPVAGNPAAFVAIDGEDRRRFERTAEGNWREVSEAPLATPQPAWRLRVDEALNRPPAIVASGPAGEAVRLTRLNPQFSAASWGTMREYGWKDAKGRPWNGGLMVPADFDPTVKHALVIQTYGFSPTRFYRDGSNVYDGFTSGFAGRAFLRENILVLALPLGPASDGPDDERGQIGAFTAGVSGAIESLVARGWVDREKVGLMGWSSTGERVLNLVTFSDTPIRAATLLDGDANTLFSMTITYAVQDGVQLRKERANEGGPYGESLARWIRNDPSLHTDCVRAALRIENYGPEVRNNWDIYALLRRQYKPVEMIVIPQGAHALTRPTERMISLQGNVDWYRFWLKGERRTDTVLSTETAATLSGQYVRWNDMAVLKHAVDAKSGCVRVAAGG